MTESYTLSSIPLSYEHEASVNSKSKNIASSPSDPASSSDSESIGENISPLFHCMVAGGFGGVVGDSTMHSLDTVKTRQQGSLNNIKYKNMIPAYLTIFKEEGLLRGLYGGYLPAVLGSFPSTALFFGTYEYSKRIMIKDFKIDENVSYFTAGILGDLASSIFYVPSEVLKTRLQLQGRYNNPYTNSGYNYKGTFNAFNMIIKNEGFKTLFFGYKQTLFRDLPFSALQLAFYEKFRQYALLYQGNQNDLPISLELLTGAAAGGLAGTLTTPLDVIKTRIQTQNPTNESINTTPTGKLKVVSSPSIVKALSSIYKNEGIVGMFSGVGPRFIWTGVQSSIMLLLYQVSLKKLDSILEENKKLK